MSSSSLLAVRSVTFREVVASISRLKCKGNIGAKEIGMPLTSKCLCTHYFQWPTASVSERAYFLAFVSSVGPAACQSDAARLCHRAPMNATARASPEQKQEPDENKRGRNSAEEEEEEADDDEENGKEERRMKKEEEDSLVIVRRATRILTRQSNSATGVEHFDTFCVRFAHCSLHSKIESEFCD